MRKSSVKSTVEFSCSTCINRDKRINNGGAVPDTCKNCYDFSNWEKLPISTLEDTLAERGKRYGTFFEHARVTQNIKAAMVDSNKWFDLSATQREALEMISHKIGRILNGDPNYFDSWHDIAGYSKLVADELQGIIK
jgi:hypothetical protein